MSPVEPVAVHVEPWVIGDCADPPQVGRTEQYVLQFLERSDPSEPGVRDWEFRAEPEHGGAVGRVERVDGTVGDEYVDVVLHADGWSAYWRAPRPVPAGPIELRGYLCWGWPSAGRPATRLRGRVDRVQVVTAIVDTSDPDRARWPVVDGGWSLRDVAESPQSFAEGYAVPYAPPGQPTPPIHYPNPWSRETGALVTLAPERACPVMPGAIAAHGDTLWIADRDGPVVLRVQHPRSTDPVVSRFDWDAPVEADPFASSRRLHADAAGCWVTDTAGVHRIEPGHGVRRVDDAPVGVLAHGRRSVVTAAADPGGTLAVLLDGSDRPRLRRHRRDGGTCDVDLPAAAWMVTGGRSGFWVLLAEPRRVRTDRGWATVIGAPDYGMRLARVDTDGTVTRGPRHELSGVLCGPEPALVHARSQHEGPRLHRIDPGDAAVDTGRPIPARPSLSVWTRAGRVFASAQLPTDHDIAREGRAAWWPFPAAPDLSQTDRHYWFAELDPETLDPITTAFVPRSPRHLDVTADGTVWLQADRRTHPSRVHYLPPGHPDARPAPALRVADLPGLDR